MSSNKTKVKKTGTSSVFQKFSLIFVWIALIIVFGLLIPDTFLTWSNFCMMFGSKAVVVILSLALMIPLIAGDFDMSAASVMGLSAMVVAILNARMGVPLIWCVLIALAVGFVIGLLNGIIISKLGVNPFIVTMAFGTILEGVTLGICNSLTITGIDRFLQEATILTRIGGIPIVFLYAIIMVAILYYFFEYTAAGRRVLVVGRNSNVARLSGINVDSVRTKAFISCGVISALAGVAYAGILGGADPSSAPSFQLPAFASVFLGAICIKPGRYNPIGTIIATYFLVTGTTGLSLMGIQTYIQSIFNGGALLIAVCVSVFIQRAQEKKMSVIAKAEISADEAKAKVSK